MFCASTALGILACDIHDPIPRNWPAVATHGRDVRKKFCPALLRLDKAKPLAVIAVRSALGECRVDGHPTRPPARQLPPRAPGTAPAGNYASAQTALRTPAAKRLVDVIPVRKSLRQHAPGAAGPERITTGIEHAAPAMHRRHAAASPGREQISYPSPLGVGQTAGIVLLGRLPPMRLGIAKAARRLLRRDMRGHVGLDANHTSRLERLSQRRCVSHQIVLSTPS